MEPLPALLKVAPPTCLNPDLNGHHYLRLSGMRNTFFFNEKNNQTVVLGGSSLLVSAKNETLTIGHHWDPLNGLRFLGKSTGNRGFLGDSHKK